jgi:uncharacterized membrane protein
MTERKSVEFQPERFFRTPPAIIILWEGLALRQAHSAEAGEKETGRVEAFSDGLFAFAMTLLVLDLKVPEHSDLAHSGELAHILRAQWPQLLNFVTSFLTVLVMWVNHHRIFTYIKGIDPMLLLFNGLLLLGVTIVPFSTALASSSSGTANARLGAAVYSGVFIAIAIFFNLLWRYAAGKDRLMGKDPDRVAIDAITERFRFGPLWYVATFAIAWASALVSLSACLALAVFFMLPYEHETTGNAPKT